MVRFRLPALSSDIKAYFGHFRKGALTILGMLLIGALIVGSFIYGNNERTQEVAEDQQASQSVTENDQAAIQPAENQEQTAPADSGGTRLPSNGPSSVANTGPEDWLAPLSGAILWLLYRKYRQSKSELNRAQIG